MRHDPEDIRKSHMKVVFKGLIMNLLVPGLIVAAGVTIRDYLGWGDSSEAAESLDRQVFFYSLMGVALASILITMFLKKRFLKPLTGLSSEATEIPSIDFVESRYTILYNISYSSSVYGLVYYLLGGEFEYFILFALASLITFRLIRPSTDFYHSLFGAQSTGGMGL